MPWAAAAVVGGALIGGAASKSAANTQADSANAATQAQLQMFNQTQQNLQPWVTSGQSSLASLQSGLANGQFTPQSVSGYANYQAPTMAQFQSDPGYQFQLQQGLNALNNQQSVTGGPNSKNLMGIAGYSEGLANTDYQQFLNNYLTQFNQGNTQTGLNNQAIQLNNNNRQQQFANLQTLSGSGQNAAAGLGSLSANVGQQIGSNIIGAGNAQAAGTVGLGNALTNGVNQGYQGYLLNQYLGNTQDYNNSLPGYYAQANSAQSSSPYDPYASSQTGGYTPQGL